MALVVNNPAANTGEVRDASSIPGLGRSPGVGNGNPLQYPYQENSMDRGAWVDHSPWGSKELDTTEHTRIPDLFYWISPFLLPLQLYKHVIQGNVVNLIPRWGD